MRNNELLEKLKNGETLLDGSLTSFKVYLDETINWLKIDLEIKFIKSKSFSKILLKFSGIQEYSFYWNKKHSFYYIERYKFFITEAGLIYLCLDPYKEVNLVEEEDQDFILCEEVVGELIEIE